MIPAKLSDLRAGGYFSFTLSAFSLGQGAAEALRIWPALRRIAKGTELNPPNERNLLRLRDVLAIVPLSRSTIYLEIAAGRFPRPVALSRRARGWRTGDVNDWVLARPEPQDAK